MRADNVIREIFLDMVSPNKVDILREVMELYGVGLSTALSMLKTSSIYKYL